MNCTAINSNQIETTPNNHHSRLMRGGGGGGGVGVVGMLPMVATPLSTGTPSQQHHQHQQQSHHRTAKASICMSGPGPGVGSGGSSGGSVNIGATTVFFHRTTNNLLDVPPTRTNSSEEENSPTELNTCRKLAEKPPLVKRLTMGILRTAEDSRPLVHSSSSPSSSSSSSQTISDGYVNEGICADTAETSLTTNVFSSKIGTSSAPSPSSPAGATAAAAAAAAGGIGHTNAASCSSRSSATAGGMGHISKGGGNSNALLLDGSAAGGQPRYNHTATTLLYPPAVPIRNDSLSLKEQHELKGAPWFQAGIPREISLEVLSRQNPGAFLVRQSTTKPGCFALSLRVPPPAPKVAHYLILRTIRGYKIKGFTKEFTSLRALITHHSVMPELLPVPLALPRPPQLGQRQEDPETYGSLNDFQNMITE
ncbi:tensin-4-like [Anopheles albimanus]|uniref:SH2 domain-containing protein n=1 Tax=Anopheles albimanus TaxID=7167 RepID=A0A182FGR1_ANOAL|nr:tensin-4-like [Anopheles albimanus]XP_035784813.1 tensin-4-like [Anopheles albimanus]XP_035784814.1 tensin-4-like [Anopheles albimanus]